ncbi:MAG: hypothetical protein JW794_06415 [Candidatus Cloacimonetes bacterium]|nr:hypothetical protein [Candidatus Cloacimonadota bacterium]
MNDLRTSQAWAPNHITGFFYSHIDTDPLRSSSLGAGVNLSRGTTTFVEVTPSSQIEISVFMNGQPTDALLTNWLVQSFLEKYSSRKYKIEIAHTMEMPVSAGFGTSGSGALSTAIALRNACGIDISDEECYKHAHIADVENKGGLGTVMAEIAGGLEIRVEFGGPGFGKVEKVPLDKDYDVIILYFGPYQTQKALTDKTLMEKVLKYGKQCVIDLLKEPSVDHFLERSQWFVQKLDIMTKHVTEIIQKMKHKGFICSMPLFGESVFSIQTGNDSHKLHDLLKEFGTTYVSKISTGGPHEI